MEQQLRQGDNWLTPAIQYEDQPDELEMSDRHYRGLGPHYGAAYPQNTATPEQADGMERGWQNLLDKAQRDIERIYEETRLAEYCASHRPGEEELAQIILMIRRRTDEQRTDDNERSQWNDGDSGQSRTRPERTQ